MKIVRKRGRINQSLLSRPHRQEGQIAAVSKSSEIALSRAPDEPKISKFAGETHPENRENSVEKWG